MKLGSSRGMDTKPPPGSERNKPRHELRLTRRSQPPYPWPPEQAQPGVSKPCRTTLPRADDQGYRWRGSQGCLCRPKADDALGRFLPPSQPRPVSVTGDEHDASTCSWSRKRRVAQRCGCTACTRAHEHGALSLREYGMCEHLHWIANW